MARIPTKETHVSPKKQAKKPTWQLFAADVARCWAAERPGKLPPAAPLSYLADAAFWQARNICGFVGDQRTWSKEVEQAHKALPKEQQWHPSSK